MICQLFILAFLFVSSSGICTDISSCFSNSLPDDVILVEGIKGDVLYSKNRKKMFVPASTIKILTALAAIHHLGEGFRFKTEFYLDTDHNLTIKGYGDPFLVSEIWDEIAKTISKKISFIKDIIIDDSYFSRTIRIPGIGHSLNPYDAPVGALCANFNTIYIKVDNNKVMSAEPQTPLIPFALRLIGHIKKGGRYVISHDIEEAERYAAELFRYFLKRHGVKVSGKIRFRYVGQKDNLIYVYHSKLTLTELIKGVMEYSNNFIVNQIMLVLGAKIYGPPATLKKGISVIKDYARYNLGLKDINIVEASGISRQNQISSTGMAMILKRFRPYMELLKKKGNMYYKTGTLKGIRTRVGYIISRKQDIYLFVLFLREPSQDISQVMDCMAHSIY